MNNSKSNQELKIGDVVQLISGGPKMTVAGFPRTGTLYCAWFIGDHDKLHNEYFLTDTVQLVAKPHKKGTVTSN